jgi:IS30 family transposase
VATGDAHARLAVEAVANRADPAQYVARQTRASCLHDSSYTTIYAYVKRELRKDLFACLYQGKSGRKPLSTGEDRRGIPEVVRINLRPSDFNDRVMPGHWEGDLIKGVRSRVRQQRFGRTIHPFGDAGRDA